MQALAIEAMSVTVPAATDVCAFPNALARMIDDDVISSIIRPRALKKIDRFCQIAMVAFEGVKDSMQSDDPDKVGLFIGNDMGGWNYVQNQLEDLIASKGVEAINPYVATAWFPAAAQGEISIAHNIRGYSKSFSGGLLSSALALEHAAQRLIDGTVDLAFAGGVEAPAACITVDALLAEQRISPEFPANEAGCLLALRRPNGTPGPRLLLSKPRRHPVAALEDLASVWRDAKTVGVHVPQVAANDDRRMRIISDLRETVALRLGDAARFKHDGAGNGDFGSATFALNVVAAAERLDRKKTSESSPALIIGTDFEGLFLAASITAN